MLVQRPRRFLWVISLVVALVAAATVAKAVWIVWENGFVAEHETYSWSIAQAKTRGTFIASVRVEPRSFELDGKQVVIGEAWIEERTVDTRFLVWFPYVERLGGQNLCVTLAEGERVFAPNSEYHFSAGQNAGSFLSIYSRGKPTLFVEEVDPAAAAAKQPITVSIKHSSPIPTLRLTFTPE